MGFELDGGVFLMMFPFSRILEDSVQRGTVQSGPLPSSPSLPHSAEKSSGPTVAFGVPFCFPAYILAPIFSISRYF